MLVADVASFLPPPPSPSLSPQKGPHQGSYLETAAKWSFHFRFIIKPKRVPPSPGRALIAQFGVVVPNKPSTL
jgi:hypothetical protein